MKAEWQAEKDAIERVRNLKAADRGDAGGGRARAARRATSSAPPS